MSSRWKPKTPVITRTILLILFCCISCSLFAQQVSTLLARDKIVIGEQVNLQIRLTGVSKSAIQQDFVFPDSVNHIEILSHQSQWVDDRTALYDITLTSFDSGYWQLPSFRLVLTNRQTVNTEPLFITVLPADISLMPDYHDIKDIIETDPTNNWWIVGGIVLLTLLALFTLLWFINRHSSKEATIVTSEPLEKAYQQLQLLIDSLEKDEANRTQPSHMYHTLSGAIRRFTDKALQQNTSYLTTGEYMMTIRNSITDSSSESKYFQFLRLADAVKFARYCPPASETNAVFEVVREYSNQLFNKTNTAV